MKTILKKRILALISAILFISAAYSAEFTLQNTTSNPGQTINVSLDITEAIPNAGAITIFFQFDNLVLDYTDNYVIVMSQASGTLVNQQPDPSKIGMIWSAPGMTGVNFPAGTMLTFEFTVLTCNNSFLNFVPILEVVDFDGNPIETDFINGTMTATTIESATWTGAAGNTWSDPANWDGGVVPGCNTDVTIPVSVNYPIIPSSKADILIDNLTLVEGGSITINGSLEIASNLILQSGPAGTASIIDNGTLTVGGTTTVNRYYAASPKWHLISSPIADGLAGIYTGMYLQRYNEPTGLWIDITNTADPLVPAKGYALWTPAPATYQYTGVLNQGNVAIPVTNQLPFGWNLLGNPYPSSLDWNLVSAANPAINGAVYYLDANSGNYVSYNGGMGGGTQYVPPMQGFFISAATTGNFEVNNSMRTHMGQNNYYKSDFENMLVLKASGNEYSDATYLRFDEQASAAFDGQFDAYKLTSGFNTDLPQLYTRTSEVNLSINVLPETDVVPLSFFAGVSGTYAISVEETYGMEYLFLEELTTGVITDLLSDDYSFDYSTEDNPDRFNLHFTVLSVNELADNHVRIYSGDDRVIVKLDQMVNGQISVVDLMGREISREDIGNMVNTIEIEGNATYIVTVVTDEHVYTEKVYIK
jgi:hypothetical protein